MSYDCCLKQGLIYFFHIREILNVLKKYILIRNIKIKSHQNWFEQLYLLFIVLPHRRWFIGAHHHPSFVGHDEPALPVRRMPQQLFVAGQPLQAPENPYRSEAICVRNMPEELQSNGQSAATLFGAHRLVTFSLIFIQMIFILFVFILNIYIKRWKALRVSDVWQTIFSADQRR